MIFGRTASNRAWPSYWLSSARQRARFQPWVVVATVAAFAALALLAQPILTAAWTSDAVRFVARAAEMKERVRELGVLEDRDAEVRRWLEDTRALVADPPFRVELRVPAPAAAFDSVATAMPVLEAATLTVAEALQRRLRVDIAVRIALLIAAGGGAWIAFRLRRATALALREPVHGTLADTPPPDPWLALIDRVMVELSGSAPGRQTMTKLSQLLRDALDATACGVCLSDEIHESMQLPPVVCAGELGWAQIELLRTLHVTGKHATFELPLVTGPDDGPGWHGVAVPVADGKTWYGHLFVVAETWPAHPEARLQVIDLVSRHLAMAIGQYQRDQESRRMALIEERTSMARELHDSLAQSLSFMKIQVSRMQTLLQRDARREEVAAAAEEVRDGLNGAYRKLRELLTTFRTQIDSGGLAGALAEALEEYGARSSVAMNLDNRLGAYPLDANEEFNVVQIVREALSNVVRHAGATQAVVKLSLGEDGWIVVSVEDDGQGFDQAVDTRSHHGTTIMRERALSLGGALSIDLRPEGGCRVVVRFKPNAAGA